MLGRASRLVGGNSVAGTSVNQATINSHMESVLADWVESILVENGGCFTSANLVPPRPIRLVTTATVTAAHTPTHHRTTQDSTA